MSRPAERRRALGDAGEKHARRFLEARGLTFLAGNWRSSVGEVDLVMHDAKADEVVFVEVKTRRGEASGRAEESVSAAQARRLLATGEAYLETRPDLADLVWRIDLVAITLGTGGRVEAVAHHPNALGEW